MNDAVTDHLPDSLEAIERETEEAGFTMPSGRKTGALLRTLAAGKWEGRLLELGTGTGLSTAWLLSGMDEHARLDSVDDDPDVLEVARRHLAGDRRVTFHCTDGARFVEESDPEHYDLIFADTWPGKYRGLEKTIELLVPGGCYVVDDVAPQPNWPDGHEDEVMRLLGKLDAHPGLHVCRMAWATGIVVATRREQP